MTTQLAQTYDRFLRGELYPLVKGVTLDDQKVYEEWLQMVDECEACEDWKQLQFWVGMIWAEMPYEKDPTEKNITERFCTLFTGLVHEADQPRVWICETILDYFFHCPSTARFLTEAFFKKGEVLLHWRVDNYSSMEFIAMSKLTAVVCYELRKEHARNYIGILRGRSDPEVRTLADPMEEFLQRRKE